MSHLKVPLFGILNFAGIFLILYFIMPELVSITNVLIATLVGLIVGIFTELIFHKRNPNKRRRRRKLPTEISTKFVLIPSILLLLLITVSVLYMTDVIPFDTSGHTVKENEETTEEEVTEEETTEETTEEETEEEDPNEICTISNDILCVEHKIEGEYKRALIKIENQMSVNMKKVRAYVNEPGEDKFLCKLYCIYGCHGTNDDEIPAGGAATFVGDQYCRFEESGELIADTKIVYENNAGTEFTKIGTLKTEII
ncbi:hypothetical protein HN865_02720 [Candidatus Woesearchaeota archaeon]|nr:hypothetical protein [Candidatus Woesearchaeota archaeon]